jgi:drug/metabolite transporter (DMT)-like permease
MTPVVLGFVLVSALMNALWNAYAKSSESPIAYLALVHWVTVLAGLPLVFFVDLGEVPLNVWFALGAAGVVHSTYMTCLSLAYEHGEMTVVYPIARATPAIVPFIAVPLMGDSVSAIGAAGIGLTFAGLWIVQTGGSFRLMREPGTGFAWLTLLAAVGYSLVDKQAMVWFHQAEWSSVLPIAVTYYFLLSVPILVLFSPYAVWRTPLDVWVRIWNTQWTRVIGGALAGLLSYTLILEALRTASISYVTAVRQTSVLFGAVLAAWLLHERPSTLRVLGSAATVAGIALIALYP